MAIRTAWRRGFFWTFLLSLVWSSSAGAVPYFAVMADTRCSHCHVSPTGGGMRDDHGVMLYSEFPLRWGEKKFSSDFKGRVSRWFALGGDFRLQHMSQVEAPRSNSFTIPATSLYLAVDPVSHLTLYADTDLANITNREAFGLLHSLPAGSWIKFGRLNLPYGLRIPDDSAFIRGDLGFSFAAQDIGLEVGMEPGPFTFAAGFTNGVGGGPADNNDDKAVSWFSEWRSKLFRLGGSFFYNNAATTRIVSGGGHTGLHLGPAAILGEFDIQGILNRTTGVERTVLAGFGEVDYELIRGLIVKANYDGIDDELAGSGLHHRVGGGVELFPIRHLRAEVLYRVRIGPGPLEGDQVQAVIHGYF